MKFLKFLDSAYRKIFFKGPKLWVSSIFDQVSFGTGKFLVQDKIFTFVSVICLFRFSMSREQMK